MISKSTIQKIEDIILTSAKTPPPFHIHLANKKGQEIAHILNADKEVVILGTLLMDCALEEALRQGKLKKHVTMSIKKAGEILNQFSEITKEEKENVLECIKEHHGSNKFHSIESEIVCNADCYRFLSVEGTIGGMRKSFEEMETEKLVNLWLEKVEEKWNLLSLDICRKELEHQYCVVREFLRNYRVDKK